MIETANDWTSVGEIALLQIQRSKLGEDGLYSPDPLATAERLRLAPRGVYGLIGGSWILDRHHGDHPDAVHWREHRTLSVGFSSHYDRMWDMFRPTTTGSAGENVLVNAHGMVTIDSLSRGVRFETEHTVLELGPVAIAEPCVPFTRFMTDRPEANASELQSQREKLRNGVRGFVMGTGDVDFVEISVGDKVSIRGA